VEWGGGNFPKKGQVNEESRGEGERKFRWSPLRVAIGQGVGQFKGGEPFLEEDVEGRREKRALKKWYVQELREGYLAEKVLLVNSSSSDSPREDKIR